MEPEKKGLDMADGDLDWVTERMNCTALKVFRRLYEDVGTDIKTFRDGNAAMGHRAMRRECDPGRQFCVELTENHRVIFEVKGNVIRIERWFLNGDHEHVMDLAAGLDRNGQCVLTDERGEELTLWRVRMNALERTFFP